MRNWMVLLLALTLVAACSDADAVKRQAATADYEAAMAEFKQVASGFVADPDAAKTAPDLIAHIDSKLDPVQDQLEKVKTAHASTLSDAQMSGVLQALSDIHAARARLLAREARVNSITVDEKSMKLQGAVAEMEAASALMQHATRDDTLVREKLEPEKQNKTSELSRFTKEQSDLQSQIDQVQGRIDQLNEKRDALLAKEQQLRQNGFVKTGDEQYNLYIEADKTLREAGKVYNDIQKIEQTELEPLLSKKRVVDRQVETTQASVDQINEALAEMGTASSDAATTREDARKERDSAADAVKAAYEELKSTYMTSVADKLAESSSEMNTSVELLDQAIGRADGALRPKLEMELAQRHGEATSIMSHYVTVMGAFGKTVAVLQQNAERSGVEQSSTFQQEYATVATRHASVLSEAKETTDKAQEYINGLVTDSGENVAPVLRNQSDIVNQRKNTFSAPESKLPGSTGDAVTQQTPIEEPIVRPSVPVEQGGGGSTAAITTPMPALPDVAFDDRVVGLVVIDGSKLSPAALTSTIKALLGGLADDESMQSMIGGMTGQYEATYAGFAGAGGTGIVIGGFPAAGEAESAPGFMLISHTDDADPAKLEELVLEMVGPKAEEDGVKLATKSVDGGWLMVFEEGKEPQAGNAGNGAIKDALAAHSGKAISFAVVIDDSLRGLAEASPAAENDELSQLMNTAQWVAGSVALGSSPLINVAIKMPSDSEAESAVTIMNEQLNTAMEDPEFPLPAETGKKMVQITQKSDQVAIRVDPKPLSEEIEQLMPALQMFMGGGLGDAPPAFDFDDEPTDDDGIDPIK